MGNTVIRVGSRSERGLRPNNEDRLVADLGRQVFVVADGMGGQEGGERASTLAVQIIPPAVEAALSRGDEPEAALRQALAEANEEVVRAGKDQPLLRRMGTTAVVALARGGRLHIAGAGDSRALLIRGVQVDQLTVDHSMAQRLADAQQLTAEQARHSFLQHVLYRFLGSTEFGDEETRVEVLEPRPGDRLLLGTDGLTNHVREIQLVEAVKAYPDPQALADYLVDLALRQGSRDNVSCIVVALDGA